MRQIIIVGHSGGNGYGLEMTNITGYRTVVLFVGIPGA